MDIRDLKTCNNQQVGQQKSENLELWKQKIREHDLKMKVRISNVMKLALAKFL